MIFKNVRLGDINPQEAALVQIAGLKEKLVGYEKLLADLLQNPSENDPIWSQNVAFVRYNRDATAALLQDALAGDADSRRLEDWGRQLRFSSAGEQMSSYSKLIETYGAVLDDNERIALLEVVVKGNTDPAYYATAVSAVNKINAMTGSPVPPIATVQESQQVEVQASGGMMETKNFSSQSGMQTLTMLPGSNTNAQKVMREVASGVESDIEAVNQLSPETKKFALYAIGAILLLKFLGRK